MLERNGRVHSKYKQLYFYVEDGMYSCVVALYKKEGWWYEGRIVYGKRPRVWGRDNYEDAYKAEEGLRRKYDYVEIVEDSKYEKYEKYVNS